MATQCPECSVEGEERDNGQVFPGHSLQCPNNECQVVWFTDDGLGDQAVNHHNESCDDWTSDSCMC